MDSIKRAERVGGAILGEIFRPERSDHLVMVFVLILADSVDRESHKSQA